MLHSINIYCFISGNHYLHCIQIKENATSTSQRRAKGKDTAYLKKGKIPVGFYWTVLFEIETLLKNEIETEWNKPHTQM